MTTTATAPKTVIPPPDTDGSLDEANRVLKKTKRELEKLPAVWRRWVISSLDQSYPAPTNGKPE